MTDQPFPRRDRETAHNLAMVNYGLLFASIFFAGLPGLVAATIAYSQRDEAPPAVRSHMNFQIRIFWVAFALSLGAGFCLLGAVIRTLGDLVTFGPVRPWSGGARAVYVDMSHLAIDGVAIILVIGAGLFCLLAGLWLVAAPAVGFIRLASQRGIGHSAAA
jgi:uncharacterized membrane protein